MDRKAFTLTLVATVAVLLLVVAVVAGVLREDQPRSDPADPPAAATSVRSGTASSPAPGTVPPLPEPFTPAAYDGWLAEIPQPVSVAHGLPEGVGDFDRSRDPVSSRFCGTRAFPIGDEIDALRDAATGPEFVDARDLRLFRDDRAAHRFLADATRTALDCPEEQHGGTTWRHDVRPVELGEEGALLVQTYETDGMVNLGASFWHLVRVGNAVLVTVASGEYLPGDTLGAGIRDHQRLLGPVVDWMCVFAAERC